MIALLGSHRHGLDRAVEIASDISKSVSVKSQECPTFLDQTFLRILADKDLDWLGERLDALLIVNYRFLTRDCESERIFRHVSRGCRGKIWVLDLFLHESRAPAWSDEQFELYRPMSTTFAGDRKRTLADFGRHLTRIVDEYMTSTLPMCASDSLLPDELDVLSSRLTSTAIYPISASYHRLRHATSDSERLLCLFEMVEILLVLSAMVGVAERWQKGDVEFLPRVFAKKSRKSHFENFALGDWKLLLEKIVLDPTEHQTAKYLHEFWDEKLSSAPESLIDQVHGSGLVLEEPVPRSHQGWLTWFVSLRNSTRGHGIVRDSFARPLWHGFHETILAMSGALRALLLDSNVQVLRGEDSSRIPSGFEASFREPVAGENNCSPVQIEIPGITAGPLCLFPFLVLSGDRILVLQRANDKANWYIDYATGKIFKHHRHGKSIFDQWSSSVRVEQGTPFSTGLSTKPEASTEKLESSCG